MDYDPTRTVRFLKNLSASFLEALIVILITQIPIMIRVIMYVLNNDGTTLSFSTIEFLYTSNFSYGDVLGLIAGILGSSTAYWVIKFAYFSRKPILLFPLIVLPITLLFFSIPVFVQDVNGSVQNTEFATRYVWALISAAAVLWIFALYQTRTFNEIKLPDDMGAARSITAAIEGEK